MLLIFNDYLFAVFLGDRKKSLMGKALGAFIPLLSTMLSTAFVGKSKSPDGTVSYGLLTRSYCKKFSPA
jgi:hypothetical protein